MTSGGAEAFKAAIRRSLPLIIGLVVLGIVAVNVFKELQGPRYAANARVLISTTPLSSIVTGIEPSFVDPQRVQETALEIADSQRVYGSAAKRSEAEFGDSASLRAATEVTGDPASDLITFTSESSGAGTAVGMVNAVAKAYIALRRQLSSAQIESTVVGLRSRLTTLPEDSPERAELEAQLTRLEVLQDESSDDQLIQRATAADQTSPDLLKDSLVGLSIGLVIAMLAVALREAIDTTVRSEPQVEDLLAVPVLATVRSLPRRTRIVTYGRHEATFADTYALLAAQLVNSTHSGSGASVLAVTSAIAEEGKTTTAANLAVAVARRGASVLLVDFDFRKPGLSQLFEVPSDAEGALQAMSFDAVDVDEVLWAVSLEGSRPRVYENDAAIADLLTARPGQNGDEGDDAAAPPSGSLHFLPAGGVIPTRQVPEQRRLSWLVSELRERADLVILDTPPALLTVEVAELSKLIDTVVVVVRQGKVSQRSLRSLRRQAQTWQADFAGVVMTDMHAEGDYSYYGGR